MEKHSEKLAVYASLFDLLTNKERLTILDQYCRGCGSHVAACCCGKGEWIDTRLSFHVWVDMQGILNVYETDSIPDIHQMRDMFPDIRVGLLTWDSNTDYFVYRWH